ncbi:MAG: GlcG protein [Rhizobacter sp.]|nr:GlcG protein [Rhizobacter sp.]
MSVLTLSVATQIVEAALSLSRQRGYPPMAVTVLDAAGDLKVAQREDGASMFRVDVAAGKSWGAVAMGVASRVLAERAKDNPNFFNALAATSRGRLLPQPGAVLIKDGSGQLLGAVGASGGTGEQDEEICAAGVSAAGLVAS